MEESLRLYRQLITEVEAAMAPLLERHRNILRCAPGCAACCQALSLLPIEAYLVYRAFLALPAARQEQLRLAGDRASTTCPLLADQRCTIYEARPLICRTHGLAIAYVDPEHETIEVSACPLNFSEDFSFGHDDLLFLDPFNARLATLNQQAARALGLAAATRLAMAEILALDRFPA